jgi:hypothetical protein
VMVSFAVLCTWIVCSFRNLLIMSRPRLLDVLENRLL